MNTIQITLLALLMGTSLSLSCTSSKSASTTKTKTVRTPPQTIQESLQRLPGLIVTANTLRYRTGRPIIVLDERIVSYYTLQTMLHPSSIKSMRMLKDQTDIKRWTNATNVTAIIEIKTL